MEKIKILLTGGHAATTGIAVTEEIRKSGKLKNSEIYWIGSETAMEGSKLGTIESKIFPKIGVHFIPIKAGKLQTKFTRHTIPSLIKIPVGFVQAFSLILKLRPNVALSFGGYSSFPVVFWCWFFRIPVILHEQTVAAGRASIASSIFATKIALARVDSEKYFPKSKTVITGNPIMSNVLKVKPKGILGNSPVILIMGGSRGSNFINELVVKVAPILLKKFRLIHITGERDFTFVNEFKNSLPAKLQNKYEIISLVDPEKIGNYYSRADMFVSRSGANSVSEILYVKRPAILIPLPKTFMKEQLKNAEYAARYGFSFVLTEKEATPEALLAEIDKIINGWPNLIAKGINNPSPDINASAEIVKLIETYL